MFDINVLTALAAIAFGVATWAVMLRFTDGTGAGDLAKMFGSPTDLTWPRGVQEEEPFHWHLDRLTQPAPAIFEPQLIDVVAECDDCADEAAAA